MQISFLKKRKEKELQGIKEELVRTKKEVKALGKFIDKRFKESEQVHHRQTIQICVSMTYLEGMVEDNLRETESNIE